MKNNLANSVDAYIANCPNEVQDELRKLDLRYRLWRLMPLNALIILIFLDIHMRAMIMTECLHGSVTRNQTCGYMFALQ